MDSNKEITQKNKNFQENFGKWYDKNYKLLLFIPLILLLLSLGYLGYSYSVTGEFVRKDISLSGGTSITILGEISNGFEEQIKSEFPDVSVRRLTDIQSGEIHSIIIETPAKPEEIVPVIERVLDYSLHETNSNI